MQALPQLLHELNTSFRGTASLIRLPFDESPDFGTACRRASRRASACWLRRQVRSMERWWCWPSRRRLTSQCVQQCRRVTSLRRCASATAPSCPPRGRRPRLEAARGVGAGRARTARLAQQMGFATLRASRRDHPAARRGVRRRRPRGDAAQAGAGRRRRSYSLAEELSGANERSRGVLIMYVLSRVYLHASS